MQILSRVACHFLSIVFIFLCLVLGVPSGTSAVAIPFANPESVEDSFPGVKALQFADLDADGDQDVVATASGQIAVWLNSGGGASWVQRLVDATVTMPTSVIVGDFDEDGALDLATVDSDAGTLSWYRNASGDASSWTRTDVVDTETGVLAVQVADFDGDGDQDLLTAADSLQPTVWSPTSVPSGFIAATWTVMATPM